jgi:hypothetical protein
VRDRTSAESLICRKTHHAPSAQSAILSGSAQSANERRSFILRLARSNPIIDWLARGSHATESINVVAVLPKRGTGCG